MKQVARGLAVAVWIVVAIGCGGGDRPTPIVDAGADVNVTPTECTADGGVSCDDGVYCNGVETCDPDSANADPVTHCVPGIPIVCDDNINCTIDSCNEASNTCAFAAPDDDGDGHDDANCLDDNNAPLGDDCDDGDDTRFPGNTEVCTPGNANATRDEDCNDTTYGDRDTDNDNHEDIRCCNPDTTGTLQCGDDCDDSDMTVYPSAGELCDGLDNDCDVDNAIDESPVNATLYRDVDGDMYGDPNGTTVISCAPIDGYSSVPTDCDDTRPTVNPGTAEACDGADNNCNNMTDEGLTCGGCTPSCGLNAVCVSDTTCVCSNGYEGDGFNCTDINECTLNMDVCDSVPDACINRAGDYVCVCPDGYIGNAMGTNGCQDFDECAIDNGGCSVTPTVSCTNTIGSRVCGACPSGYAGTGIGTCTDINECATNNGGCGNAMFYSCANNIGAAPTCADIIECATNNGGCDTSPVATCNEVIGGPNTCTCPSGYTTNNAGVSCDDVNECTTNNGGCGSATYWTCTNSTGSYACTDINECALNTDNCHANAACTNRNDGFTCTCNTGLHGNGVTTCVAFVVNGDGTVSDPLTGLTWSQAESGNRYTQPNAVTYCAGLSLAGTGWRLPTITELESLVDLRYVPTIDPVVFPGTVSGAYWSSTLNGPASAWYVYFYQGWSNSRPIDNDWQARCVRP